MFDDISPALRLVLGSPDRVRFLFADGPKTLYDLTGFLRRVVPRAGTALAMIRARAQAIPDPLLRHEALSSIDGKSYHVAGAAILATFLPRGMAERYVDIVTPLESIYDYLDNLCDRHPHVDARAYPVLHQAIADALDPEASVRDYYTLGPQGDDGGYLCGLVLETQSALRHVANLHVLRPLFAEAAKLYAEMQTFTQLARGERERACVAWYESNRPSCSDLDWHEFACAAGSQFQVYAPLYAAMAGGDRIAETYAAYFPYVSALHVMLDSFIDRREDETFDELNFAAVYQSGPALRVRAAFLAERARERFAQLPQPQNHAFVVRVMTLFYLSHPKIAAQGLDRDARRLLKAIK